jgi:hypothetical protein
VLYADGRMANVLDRRYATECRPPAPDIVPDRRTDPDKAGQPDNWEVSP